MPGQAELVAEGVVTEVLSARAFWVRLPNGHRLVGHGSRRLGLAMVGLVPGDRVTLALSPYDLSSGRIVQVTKNVT